MQSWRIRWEEIEPLSKGGVGSSRATPGNIEGSVSSTLNHIITPDDFSHYTSECIAITYPKRTL